VIAGRGRILAVGGALAVVGIAQALFTAGVDPHARCAPDPAIDAALADAGLDRQERCLTDATAYHLLGDQLARDRAYVRPFDRVLLGVDRPTAEYPPAFPTAIAAADRLGIDSIAGQQLVLGTAMALLTALAAAELARALGATTPVTVAAVVAVGLHPHLLQANALLMTEGMFAALSVFVVLATLHVARRAPGRPSLAGAPIVLGGLLGIASLTRGEALVWVPVVALALLVGGRTLGRNAVVTVVAFVAVAAIVVAPWTLRNRARLDAFVPVSNNIGTVLDGANCNLTYRGATIGAWRSTFTPSGPADVATDRDTPCFEGFLIEDPDFSEAAAANRARHDGIEYALDHVERWPLVVAARWGRTLGLFNVGQQVNLEALEGRSRSWQWAGTIVWWVAAPLAAVAWWQRRRDRATVVALAVPGVAVLLTTALTYGNQRFRIGLDPIVLVLAVLGIAANRVRR
jgi:hypothetical protein